MLGGSIYDKEIERFILYHLDYRDMVDVLNETMMNRVPSGRSKALTPERGIVNGKSIEFSTLLSKRKSLK